MQRASKRSHQDSRNRSQKESQALKDHCRRWNRPAERPGTLRGTCLNPGPAVCAEDPKTNCTLNAFLFKSFHTHSQTVKKGYSEAHSEQQKTCAPACPPITPTTHTHAAFPEFSATLKNSCEGYRNKSHIINCV